MLYQSGLKSYKKKTSYKPYIFIALLLILSGTGFFFRQGIKNLFAGDRKILLEKERKNIQQQIRSGALEETSVKKFSKRRQRLCSRQSFGRIRIFLYRIRKL